MNAGTSYTDNQTSECTGMRGLRTPAIALARMYHIYAYIIEGAQCPLASMGIISYVIAADIQQH